MGATTPNLPPGAYQIQINEVPVVTGQATLGHILVNDTVDRLRLMNVQGTEAVLHTVRRCFASLYTDRAISYRADKGFDPIAIALTMIS